MWDAKSITEHPEFEAFVNYVRDEDDENWEFQGDEEDIELWVDYIKHVRAPLCYACAHTTHIHTHPHPHTSGHPHSWLGIYIYTQPRVRVTGRVWVWVGVDVGGVCTCITQRRTYVLYVIHPKLDVLFVALKLPVLVVLVSHIVHKRLELRVLCDGLGIPHRSLVIKPQIRVRVRVRVVGGGWWVVGGGWWVVHAACCTQTATPLKHSPVQTALGARPFSHRVTGQG